MADAIAQAFEVVAFRALLILRLCQRTLSLAGEGQMLCIVVLIEMSIFSQLSVIGIRFNF